MYSKLANNPPAAVQGLNDHYLTLSGMSWAAAHDNERKLPENRNKKKRHHCKLNPQSMPHNTITPFLVVNGSEWFDFVTFTLVWRKKQI